MVNVYAKFELNKKTNIYVPKLIKQIILKENQKTFMETIKFQNNYII